MKPVRLHTQEPAKKAAVLIPLCLVDDKVSLLYTLRAAHLKNHRGQVSFPGGMQDFEDKCLEDTALRETNEELGRIKEAIEIDKLKINTREVEEVFTVPLEDLCNPSKIGYTQFRGTYSIPVFFGGQMRIWGLTAIITNMCLRSLLPHKAYSHPTPFLSTLGGKIILYLISSNFPTQFINQQ
ncbi:hypothetical protein NQ317_016327 [Molorchus minor]|uniref:Nudix hydrolase domain-containing protein n=1 Tax=Molorchus minor TaxID=1323400 RepID=A0ABQ9IY84_9CUCU|nr:hypothetical protein NQ317_016327 [Molorchus minor]